MKNEVSIPIAEINSNGFRPQILRDLDHACRENRVGGTRVKDLDFDGSGGIMACSHVRTIRPKITH